MLRRGLIVAFLSFGGILVRAVDDGLTQQAISIPGVNIDSFILPPDIKVTNEQLADLAGNIQERAITSLTLAGHQEISDDSLQAFKNSTGLRELSLRGTGIHDDGMSVLGKLTQLESLDLSDTLVGDDGVAQLAGLKKLKKLKLKNTSIDDKGL